MINCLECVTQRQLFERVLVAVRDALGPLAAVGSVPRRCDSVASLGAELQRMLEDGGGSRGGSGRRRPGEDENQIERNRSPRRRFVLVFDAVDRQREATDMLLPGLARLSSHACCPSLTTVFVLTHPSPNVLRLPAVPHVHFPPYGRGDMVTILSAPAPCVASVAYPPPDPPFPSRSAGLAADGDDGDEEKERERERERQKERLELWQRFLAAVHDSLVRSAGDRSLPSLRRVAEALWPDFVSPIVRGEVRPREFSRLLIASRHALADETLLLPTVLRAKRRKDGDAQQQQRQLQENGSRDTSEAPMSVSGTPVKTPSRAATTLTTPVKATPTRPTNTLFGAPTTPRTPHTPTTAKPLALATTTSASAAADLTSRLPTTARLLLAAAYLAAHNPARTDYVLFSTHHERKRRRRGGAIAKPGRKPTKRKIARKLLGAHAFVFERMTAVLAALRSESAAVGVGGADGVTKEVTAASGTDADVAMAVATLASLRLLVRAGAAGAGATAGGVGGGAAGTTAAAAGPDVLDRAGRWRINVGWDVVRAVGRSVGLELEDWLVEG